MTTAPPLAYEPIVLGATCEAKFQTSRKLYFDHYRRKSEAGFRMQMMPPDRGARFYGWSVFDWQIVPFAALLTILERDFEGAMEREALEIEGNFIYNRALGTEHSHLFQGFEASWTGADLDRVFPVVKRRYEARAAEFRQRLLRPGPYLYIWTASYYKDTDRSPTVEQVERLIALLGARSPEHRFHLLMVANEGEGADYSALGEKVTTAIRLDETGKTPTMAWEGNDARWAEILSAFELTLRDIEGVRQPASAAAAEPVALPPSLLTRLLGR